MRATAVSRGGVCLPSVLNSQGAVSNQRMQLQTMEPFSICWPWFCLYNLLWVYSCISRGKWRAFHWSLWCEEYVETRIIWKQDWSFISLKLSLCVVISSKFSLSRWKSYKGLTAAASPSPENTGMPEQDLRMDTCGLCLENFTMGVEAHYIWNPPSSTQDSVSY